MAIHKWKFHFAACPVLLSVMLASVLFSSDNIVRGQTGPQSFDEAVHAKHKRFVEYHQTFNSFAQSGLGSDEFHVAMSLTTIASRTGDYLWSVHILLEIYGGLSCEEDRARVRPIIERELNFYSKLIEVFVDEANLNIAHTHMPGVAAEGTRMRDDLRGVKSIFDSIKLP
ncbi:MAG TPA: hypothetical protein VGR03_09765 [Candidatus Acidoferrum sp.]|nr:hypothetical protein [Candidatus Acidoferrum sp.]